MSPVYKINYITRELHKKKYCLAILNNLRITVITYKAYMLGALFSFVFFSSASAERTPTVLLDCYPTTPERCILTMSSALSADSGGR